MQIQHSDVLNFLPSDEKRSWTQLAQSIAKNFMFISIFCLVIVLISPFFFRMYEDRNAERKGQKHIKKTTFLFKKTISFSYLYIWVGLLLYSISLIDIPYIFNTIFSKNAANEIFKIAAVLASGPGYAAFYAGIFIMNNSFWIIVLGVLVGVFLLSTFFIKKKKTGIAAKIKATFYNIAIPGFINRFIFRLKKETLDFKDAFFCVCKNADNLFIAFIVPAIVLTYQLVILAHIISKVERSPVYVIPLLFLVDWAYNLSVVFCKFYIYSFINRNEDVFKHLENTGDELKQEQLINKISFQEIKNNFPDLCLFSLQLTCFSIIRSFQQIFTLVKCENETITKIIDFLNTVETQLHFVFAVNEFFCDQRVFNHVMMNKYLEGQKTKNNESLEAADSNQHEEDEIYVEAQDHNNIDSAKLAATISHNVFRDDQIFIFTCLCLKNTALKFALHAAMFSAFILGYQNPVEGSIEIGREAIFLFDIVFKNLSIPAIILFTIYLTVSYFFLSIEAAYIMKKKIRLEEIEASPSHDYVIVKTVKNAYSRIRRTYDKAKANIPFMNFNEVNNID